MFKRVVWMGVGAAAGAAATLWTERKVKTQLDQLAQRATPHHVAELTRAKVGDVRDTVVAAVNEGRTAKQSSEREMRRTVDSRWGPNREGVGRR